MSGVAACSDKNMPRNRRLVLAISQALDYTQDMQTSVPLSEASFSRRLNLPQLAVFIGFHLLTLALLFQVDWSLSALLLWFGLHQLRFFGLSVVLHRYFSHRAFQAHRPMQFLLALIGALTMVRGPIRFAAAHRYHHQHSDTEADLHAPQHGFAWSYVGWLMSDDFEKCARHRARDLRKYPELRLLDRFYWLPSVLLAGALYLWGGLDALVWGGLVSVLSTWHLAFFITSVFHVWGRQDFATGDHSRNHALLAWITLGEGWHNNHHYDMHSAQMSARRGQVDLGFVCIRVMEKLGLIYNVKRFGASKSRTPDLERDSEAFLEAHSDSLSTPGYGF